MPDYDMLVIGSGDIVDSFRHDLQDRGIALRLGEDVERVENHADGALDPFPLRHLRGVGAALAAISGIGFALLPQAKPTAK